MSAVTMEQVLLAGFQADTEADKYTELLRSNLGLSAKNRVARLAMGRSLSETTHPSASLSGAGKPIKGDVLFGVEELPLWVGLLFTHLRRVNPRADLTLATLQDIVKRHWSRGIALLMADWEEANEDYNRFIDILVRRRADMPESGSASATTTSSDDAWATIGSPPAPILVDLGKAVDSKEPFRWKVNGVGYSPHVAVMGQAGSGKTRTMLELVKQVRKQSGAPVILLDLGKGDLANRHDFIEAIGARVLRVPEEPIPLDMFFGSDESELTASDAIMGFRDSFAKVMQSKAGAVQLETMKDALRPLFSQRKNISLDDIAQSLRDFYDDRKLKTDSVISTISDLTERTIFRRLPAQN